LAGFEDLPDALIPSDLVLRPKRRFWKSFLRSSTKALARQRQALKHGFVASMLLLVTGAIGAAVYSAREEIPLESIEVLLPGHDSPDKVLAQYVDITNAMVNQMASVSDAKTRDRTIPMLRRLSEGCQSLEARAAAIGPLSDMEFLSLADWLQTRLPEQSKKVTEMAKTLQQQRTLGSPKLQAVLFDLTTATKQFGPTIEMAWRSIPQPESETQSIAYKITMIQYRVWSAVVSVSNEDEYRELDEVLASAATEFESILVYCLANIQDDQTVPDATPYSRCSAQLSSEILSRVDALRSDYGDPSDVTTLQRFRDAATALRNLPQTHQGQAIQISPAGVWHRVSRTRAAATRWEKSTNNPILRPRASTSGS
jgi:hypothetical protein